MKENFTNIKNDPLVAAAAKILTGCTQLDETVELQEMSNTKIAKDIKKGDSFKAVSYTHLTLPTNREV